MIKKIIVAVVIGILTLSIYVMVFVLLFQSFTVNRNMERQYPGFEYGTSVLFEGVFRTAWNDSEQSEMEEIDFILMFRWEYNELLNRMKENLRFTMKNLVSQNLISDFQINEQAMTVKMTVKGCTDEEEVKRFCSIKEEINDICSLYYIFTYKELPEESKEWVTLYDVEGNQIQEMPILTPEEVEKEEKKRAKEEVRNSYNEEDIKCLDRILSRSKNKTPFDFSDGWKIKGDAGYTGYTGYTGYGAAENIYYLDLSDYSDITGELDLTGFANLHCIVLRGMKIDSVILPDTFTSIDSYTFENCKNLTHITIPKSVKSFSSPVFSGCKNLKEVVFEGNAPKVSGESRDVFGKVPEDLVIYRKKSAKGWQEICWDKYDVRIID